MVQHLYHTFDQRTTKYRLFHPSVFIYKGNAFYREIHLEEIDVEVMIGSTVILSRWFDSNAPAHLSFATFEDDTDAGACKRLRPASQLLFICSLSISRPVEI